MDTLIRNANILIEALPYIQKLSGKTVVIKYGGNAMLGDELTMSILQDITLLKYVGVNVVVVHGGGPEINSMLGKLEIESSFHNGLRITTADTIDVVQMVLTGRINKDIVAKLNTLGAVAIGVSGLDGGLIKCRKRIGDDGVDLGFVGDVIKINSKLLKHLSEDEYIPVIAPIGVDDEGQSYNINADTVAGEVAAALKAEKLMFLTDIDGIRLNPSDPDTLVSHITIDEVNSFIKDGTIAGGMIPKVQGCIKALDMGVNRTHILNGTLPHPIILEIFTDRGIGTMVTK